MTTETGPESEVRNSVEEPPQRRGAPSGMQESAADGRTGKQVGRSPRYTRMKCKAAYADVLFSELWFKKLNYSDRATVTFAFTHLPILLYYSNKPQSGRYCEGCIFLAIPGFITPDVTHAYSSADVLAATPVVRRVRIHLVCLWMTWAYM